MAQSSNRQQGSVRLPKLEIPPFNGYKLKWSEFWDSFSDSVHKNTSISDIEKVNYLISKLTREQTVSGILPINENYSFVLESLKERYDIAQTVVDPHYVELVNLKLGPTTEKGLRTLYDHIVKHSQRTQGAVQ